MLPAHSVSSSTLRLLALLSPLYSESIPVFPLPVRSPGVFATPLGLCHVINLVGRRATLRVPQIYDGDMLDPVKQARSARDFVSRERGVVVRFAGVHRRCFLFLFFFYTLLLSVSYPFSVIFAITSGPVSTGESRDINHDYGALKRRQPPSFALP